MSLFGPILPGSVVAAAVETTLKIWLEVYLRETERQAGVTYHLPLFASYNTRPDNQRWIEEQLPACIIIVHGLAGTPLKDGEGNYTAPFSVSVAIFSKGRSKEATEQNSKLYAAAVRAILLQQSGLGGLSNGVSWEGEAYDQSRTRGGRTIGSAVVDLIVQVPGTVNSRVGPNEPPNLGDVGQDWPTALSAYLEVKKEEDE
jgi:hypothetical protein